MSYVSGGVQFEPITNEDQLVYDLPSPINLNGAQIVFNFEAYSAMNASGANIQPIVQEKQDWKGDWCWIGSPAVGAGTYTCELPATTSLKNSESCGKTLREVTSWGGVEWRATKFMFSGCSNLTTLPSEAPNLSNVKYMSGMFLGATNFNQDIGGWVVRNVERMWRMFDGATKFNQDIGGWDVRNVKDMGRMFWGAEKFDHSINNWQPHDNVSLKGFIHKGSAYEKNNYLPQFCLGRLKEDSNESVCLSDDIYKPEESDTAQSPEPAEDE